MAKLWQKTYTVDSLIESFTVGKDYEIDRNLVQADCCASIAHVRMLGDIGILQEAEAEALEAELLNIISLDREGLFHISREDEDCHTAIEGHLTQKLGEAGKKVHTGRSRNDQVHTALRLWARDMLFSIIEEGLSLAERLRWFAEMHIHAPMPGRTHMQIAMPSSVGLWAAAYGEEIFDETALLFSVLDLVDQSPLGSAASYGVPLPLDRELTAELLGFSRVQNNVLYANNSRGKFEAVIVDGLEYLALTMSKIAQDLIIFSLPEIGYFSLPEELCTGSSIMPQKKNPDGLELIRSKAALVSSYGTAIKNVIRSLPSGYNRDFQDTKEPFMTAGITVCRMLQVMDLTFDKVKVNKDVLEQSFTPEIYATDHALEHVRQGMSFRDAYRKVGSDPALWDRKDPAASIVERTSRGTAGNLRLDILEKEIRRIRSYGEERRYMRDEAMRKLTGEDIRFFSVQPTGL